MSVKRDVAIGGAGLGAAVALAVGAGCGPSYQAIYESEVRFEHCYALDESSTATLTTKAACWDEYIRNHTYGQTHDRVAYAARRRSLLQRVPELPTDEALMLAAPGGGAVESSSEGAPASVYAPPPRLQASRDGGTGGGLSAVPTATAAWTPSVAPVAPDPSPYDGCLKTCREGWLACIAANKSGIPKCDATYKSCLRNCLK